MIHVVSSQPHYAAHLLPLVDELVRRGIEAESFDTQSVLADDGTPTVIAGQSDLGRVPHSRPVALVSHGVDQTYLNLDHGSYAGGRNRERISLFLCSTPRGLATNQAVYPAAAHVLCGPLTLDRWYSDGSRLGGVRRGQAWRGSAGRPVVAFSTHFDLTIVPETRSAFGYYLPVLERIALDGQYELLGHAHPRAWESIEGHYARLGIEQVRDLDEVFVRADLFVVDNSSTLWEAAAIGIPVLALDAPFYRDQPRQEPRFYADVPGLRLRAYREQGADCGIVHPAWGRDNLGAAIQEALNDDAELVAKRESVIADVYGDTLDGRAAVRAANAVIEWARL